MGRNWRERDPTKKKKKKKERERETEPLTHYDDTLLVFVNEPTAMARRGTVSR